MLSSFWRRKNARLVKRLNNAVEAAERLNEVYSAPRPPRVEIDTSYVDQHHHSDHEATGDAHQHTAFEQDRNVEGDATSTPQTSPMPPLMKLGLTRSNKISSVRTTNSTPAPPTLMILPRAMPTPSGRILTSSRWPSSNSSWPSNTRPRPDAK